MLPIHPRTFQSVFIVLLSSRGSTVQLKILGVLDQEIDCCKYPMLSTSPHGDFQLWVFLQKMAPGAGEHQVILHNSGGDRLWHHTLSSTAREKMFFGCRCCVVVCPYREQFWDVAVPVLNHGLQRLLMIRAHSINYRF